MRPQTVNREQKARDLMAAIRYQVFRPEVTTMGACANGCGESARGAGVCRNCLGADLDDMTDSMTGTAYVYACEALRSAELAVLDAAGDDGGVGAADLIPDR